LLRELGTRRVRSGLEWQGARRVGISREGPYKALSAEGNPSFATIIQVDRALELRIHFESVA
jgi:probable addiction module antidote protein